MKSAALSAPAPVCDADVYVRDCRLEDTVCVLKLDWPDAFSSARAGQFALLKSLIPGAPLLPRPLSLIPAPDGLFIAFNIVREGTRLLSEARPGDKVTLIGPLGNTFSPPPDPIAIVVDAPHAGTMLALAHERAVAGHRADTVVYVTDQGRPHPSDRVLLNAFAATGAKIVTATGDIAPKLEGFGYVAAGAADGTMAEAQSAAERMGMEGEASLQAAMACGLGVCQVCVHPARSSSILVCDGPVFPLRLPSFRAASR
ncbi:MAG: hypothetical protein AAFW98_01280 [Pseudomonadota bacterium]